MTFNVVSVWKPTNNTQNSNLKTEQNNFNVKHDIERLLSVDDKICADALYKALIEVKVPITRQL